MKKSMLLIGISILFAFCGESFAALPLTASAEMWRTYMSPPRNKNADEQYANEHNITMHYDCEDYARIGCIEGIYRNL
jgi:hypothetical protein